MAERRRAVAVLLFVAVAMIVFVLSQAAGALRSGGFAPLSVVPALVPPVGLIVLAVGLRRGSGWALLGSRVLAVALALVGAGAVTWFTVTSAALGPAVASAGPVVLIILAVTVVGAILLWRGANGTTRPDARH